MREGIMFGVRILGKYFVMLLLSLMFLGMIPREQLWLQAILNAAILAGFALLRKDRPEAARPIRLPRIFVPLSVGLSALLSVLLVVGATGFSITGYGGVLELGIAVSILAGGVVLWWFVQRQARASADADHGSA